VLGYACAALMRWGAVAVLLTVVALAVGMQVGGSGVDLFGLYGLAVLVNLCGVLWAAGIAMRFRTVQAGPLMQTPVFTLLFLAPVYVPLALLQGWIHAVASVNPVTFFLTSGRGFVSGDPTEVVRATAIAFGLAGALLVWALRGLRAAERAG